MAVYQSAGKRRRNAALLVLVGLVVGALLGLLVGRATAPTVSDAISRSRTDADAVIASLQALPFEYDQTRAGAPGKSDATFAASLDQVRHRLDAAISAPGWISSRTRSELLVTVDRLRTDARSHVAVDRFSADVNRSVDAVASVFGVTAPPVTGP